MTKYRLVGFTAPTVNVDTFLIPVFSANNSNYSFAQELDGKYNITEFLLFNPGDYEKVDLRTPFIELAAGDCGLIAFLDVDRQVFYGTHSEIIEILKNYDLNTRSAFFRMEAYSLMNEESLYDESCRLTKLMFDNKNAQDVWHELNIVKFSRLKYATQQDQASLRPDHQEVADLIEYLTEIFDDQKWHTPWKQAWDKFPCNKDLLLVAIKWLSSEARPKNSIAQVIISLLKSNLSNIAVNNHAEAWLLSNDIGGRIWPTIWILLNGAEIYSEPSFSIGLSFLDAQLGDKETLNSKQIYNWSKVWSIIYKEKRHNVYLLRSAMIAAEGFGNSEHFNRLVINTILKNRDAEKWAVSQAFMWLKNHRSPESLWAETFIMVDGYYSNLDIRELLKDWLCSTSIGKNWFRIWNMKRKTFNEQDRAIILRQALSQNPNYLSLWAAVMSDLIANNYSTLSDREIAYEWLHNNTSLSYTRYYIQLENVLSPRNISSVKRSLE